MTKRIAYPSGAGCLLVAGVLGGLVCVVGLLLLLAGLHNSAPSAELIGAVLAAAGGLAVAFRLAAKRQQATIARGLASVLEAVTHQVSRPPDYVITGPPGRYAAIAFVAEKRLYLGDPAAPFDPAKLFGPADIRRWEVNKHEEFDGNGRLQSTTHFVAVEVAAVDTPVVHLVTHSEGIAFKVREILNQTLG